MKGLYKDKWDQDKVWRFIREEGENSDRSEDHVVVLRDQEGNMDRVFIGYFLHNYIKIPSDLKTFKITMREEQVRVVTYDLEVEAESVVQASKMVMDQGLNHMNVASSKRRPDVNREAKRSILFDLET